MQIINGKDFPQFTISPNFIALLGKRGISLKAQVLLCCYIAKVLHLFFFACERLV